MNNIVVDNLTILYRLSRKKFVNLHLEISHTKRHSAQPIEVIFRLLIEPFDFLKPMIKKEKYLAPELKVVEFRIESGFAASGFSALFRKDEDDDTDSDDTEEFTYGDEYYFN